MKTKTKGFVTYKKCAYGGPEFHFQVCDMSELGYATVIAHTIEFEIPDDFNPVATQVAQLEEEKRRCRAAFQARITQIERQIQSLLAIEHVEVA